MITRQVFAVVVFDDTPSYLIHAVDAEQLLGGNAAKHHNQGGVNQLNLLEEVERGTRVDLTFSGRTVVFWTAFDSISDEEISAIHSTAGQHLIQKASGRADERLTALVFLAAGLVLATFCMKRLIPLRALAITSNVAFILYGYSAGIEPVLILHVILLPINLFRLQQTLLAHVSDDSRRRANACG